jgi:hypothetical protein
MQRGEAGRVFISYRRQDTAWPARLLYDLLVAELGVDRVDKDVDNIERGEHFVERVQSAVGSCDVLLALIGRRWLAVTDGTGARCIDDPDDFVRLEVETALNRDDVRVIPILVDNAKMPSPQELPRGLATLPGRQAVEIDPINFDTRRLLRVLNDTLNDVGGELAGPSITGIRTSAARRTPPPAPPVESAWTARSDDRGSLPAAPATDRSAGRRRMGLLVADASPIVVLLAVSTALWLWYLMPQQDIETNGSASPAPASSPPSITPAPSASPSGTSTAQSPTGSNILAHRGGDEKYRCRPLSPSRLRPMTASR